MAGPDTPSPTLVADGESRRGSFCLPFDLCGNETRSRGGKSEHGEAGDDGRGGSPFAVSPFASLQAALFGVFISSHIHLMSVDARRRPVGAVAQSYSLLASSPVLASSASSSTAVQQAVHGGGRGTECG